MMCATHLMTIELKQPDIPSVSPDHNQVGGASFAQSFAEQIKASAETSASAIPDAGVREVLKSKGQTDKQISLTNVGVSEELKGKPICGRLPSIQTVSVPSAGGAAVTPADSSRPAVPGSPAAQSDTKDETAPLAIQSSSEKLQQNVITQPVEIKSAGSIIDAAIAPEVMVRVAGGSETPLLKVEIAAKKTEGDAPIKKAERKLQHPASSDVEKKAVDGVSSINGAAIELAIAAVRNGTASPSSSGGGLQNERAEVSPVSSEKASQKGAYAASAGAASSHPIASEFENSTSGKTTSGMPPTLPATALEQTSPSRQGIEVEKAAGSSAVPSGDGNKLISTSNSTHMTGHDSTLSPAAVSGIMLSPLPQTFGMGDLGMQKGQLTQSSLHGGGTQALIEEPNGLTEAGLQTGSPHMLTMTPTALEVGIQNGSHGWLQVRAEMDSGGGVSASVSAASPSGQEMLHRELPALTAYLQGEKLSVNAVVIHSPIQPRIEDQGFNASAEAGQAQHRSTGGGQRQQDTGTPQRTGQAISLKSIEGDNGDILQTAVVYSKGGGWLSVRA